MMSEEKAVKVGDMVNSWNLSLPEYDGCEFKVFAGSPKVEITKVPDPKPEIPDEPMTRGAVVTIEGDDEFIAVRFTGADDLPYPFVGAHSVTGDESLFEWEEIILHASGRKIIVHNTVDTTKAPLAVETYEEWLEIPRDELKKYKWRDVEGDIWLYDPFLDTFLTEEEDYGLDFHIKEFLPLTRDEKIG